MKLEDEGVTFMGSKTTTEERCPMGHQVKFKNVVTLEQSSVNENNFKYVQRDKNKKVN